MGQVKTIKAALVYGWLFIMLVWAASGSFPTLSSSNSAQNPAPAPGPSPPANPQDYVGTDTCRSCHDDQFNNFSHTAHAGLSNLASWRGRVTGCETCHGPGRAHTEAGGDPALIISFANLTPKQVSETCLACHSGREEHNNFRRGEHWRNDIGCIQCHTSHSPPPAPSLPGSATFREGATRQNPDRTTFRMLRASEPQLCLNCHTEQRAQFSMPFHHRVLEGAMRCSDCHNPHGGFEQRQTRLAVGADAACIRCHTDKQGPFVYEHAPLRLEGCASCHQPHGSSNPRMLARSQVRQLCLECHSNAHEIGAPDTPTFHNQATVRYQNCTTCHSRIHGSHTNRFFFR